MHTTLRTDDRLGSADLTPDRSLSADELKAAFRRHPAGVSVVTADDGSGPVAMTATSVFSVSVDPPLFIFSASNLSSSTPTILRSETVVTHMIDVESLHIAKLGATSGIDRFADTGTWRRLPTGEPVFNDVKVWIRGKIVKRLDAGGATVIVVHAMESSLGEGGPALAQAADAAVPLVYHSRTWHQLGTHSTLDS